MKPKMKLKWGLIAAIPLALFLGLARLVVRGFGLTSPWVQVVWIGFGLLGALIGGLIFWFIGRMGSGREPKVADPLEEDLAARLAEIRRRLSAAKRPALEKLPVVLVLGSPRSGKSSAIVGSDVAAEQLTGDSISGSDFPPTKSINAWFSDGTVLIEVGGELREHATLWLTFLKRIRPRRLFAAILTGKPQAPRAAVVCFSFEEFLNPGGREAVVESARGLRKSLLELSQALGVQLPVYVLFTKAEEVPSFSEYCSQLKEGVVRQVLGSTLPPPTIHEAATYADRQSQTLRSAFKEIFRSLALKRLKYLDTALDPDEAGKVYEFPREFGKLSDPASQFLVELCKPSQLDISPFLRGFYIVGREESFIDSPEPRPPEDVPEPAPAAGATQVFDLANLAGSVPPPPPIAQQRTGVRHRWVFLSRVFRDVIMRDDIAVWMMREGQRVNLGRRVLLGTILAVILFGLTPWLFITFFQSRGLQKRVDVAIEDVRGAAIENPSELLPRLEVLRGNADILQGQLSEGGFRKVIRRMGFSPAAALYPEVIGAYSGPFVEGVLSPALNAIQAELRALPPGPDSTSDWHGPYDRLQAYLMSTEYPDSGEAVFMEEVLLRHSPWGPDVENEDLLRAQFGFFGRDLRKNDLFPTQSADDGIVGSTREFLAAFAGARPFYVSLINEANGVNRDERPISGDPSGTLVIPTEVPPAFSLAGRAYVKARLEDSDNLPQPKEWVLGERPPVDLNPFIAQIDALYEAESSDQWAAVLRGASVVWFRDETDAEEKLGELAGREFSPLISLLSGVFQNVERMPENQRGRFRALGAFLEPDSTTPGPRLTGPGERYLEALTALQGAMATLASAGENERLGVAQELLDGQPIRNASDAADLLTSQMNRGGGGGQVAADLSRIIRQPIEFSLRLAGASEPATLNSWGQDFCDVYRQRVGRKFPFDASSEVKPSLDDLNAIFEPIGSRLTEFQGRLASYVTWYGDAYEAAQGRDGRINEEFLQFLTNARRFSEAIYATDPERAGLTFSLLPLLDSIDARVQTITLFAMGDTHRCVRNPRDCSTMAGIEWTGSNDMNLHLTVLMESGGRPIPVTENPDSLWAPFEFFQETTGWRGRNENEHTVSWLIPGVEGRVTLRVSDAGGPGAVGRSVWVFDPDVMRGLQCVETIVGGL